MEFNLTLATVLIFASLFIACKKDNKNKQENIIGSWTNSIANTASTTFNQTYQFNTDSTVRFSRTVNDLSTKKILGYEYLSTGKFRLNGEQLKIYNIVASYNDEHDSSYVALTKLTPLQTDTVQTYTIKIDATGNSFYFYAVPCPPNALCVGQVTYTKQ